MCVSRSVYGSTYKSFSPNTGPPLHMCVSKRVYGSTHKSLSPEAGPPLHMCVIMNLRKHIHTFVTRAGPPLHMCVSRSVYGSTYKSLSPEAGPPLHMCVSRRVYGSTYKSLSPEAGPPLQMCVIMNLRKHKKIYRPGAACITNAHRSNRYKGKSTTRKVRSSYQSLPFCFSLRLSNTCSLNCKSHL
jgi:hypothetical protein